MDDVALAVAQGVITVILGLVGIQFGSWLRRSAIVALAAVAVALIWVQAPYADQARQKSERVMAVHTEQLQKLRSELADERHAQAAARHDQAAAYRESQRGMDRILRELEARREISKESADRIRKKMFDESLTLSEDLKREKTPGKD